MPIRVVLLGDLPADLRQQILALPSSLDLHLGGAYADREAARSALSTLSPDVAIVAAAMTDGSGFEFVDTLTPKLRPPAVVFVSPREEDAVRAFELHATDFVPMPVVASRLNDAMLRARQQALQSALLRTAEELQRLIGATSPQRAPAASFNAPVLAATGSGTTARGGSGSWSPSGTDGDSWRSADEPFESSRRREATAGVGTVGGSRWRQTTTVPVQLLGASRSQKAAVGEGVLDLTQTGDPAGAAAPDGRPLRVLVREGRRTRFIPLSDVDWFEADGNYILVHAADQRYRTRGTITAIESGLDPRQFVRIHRRMVVNMDRVREMSPLPGGDGLLVLGSGTTLRLSRTYRARVR